jgi:hypothetical protein
MKAREANSVLPIDYAKGKPLVIPSGRGFKDETVLVPSLRVS